MVREGYAEAFCRRYLKEPYKSEFLKAEREARLAKMGIWSHWCMKTKGIQKKVEG